MNLVALDNDLYQLELVEKGGSVSGNYDKLTPEREILSGTAASGWVK